MTAGDDGTTRAPWEGAVGVGCLRLADGSVDEGRAIETLVAAVASGVTVIDTADVYAPGDDSIGAGERLVARALAHVRAGGGDAHGVRVVTKGGLRREGGRWRPDGRARHLAAACEASLRALDVDAVDLYLLHAPDPRTPIATSARALEGLRRAGLAREIGLSNVGVAQIEEAARVASIAAVQVRFGPGHDAAARGGVLATCRARGIAVLAHTPFGGARGARRLARHPALVSVAARHAALPLDVAVAWLIVQRVVPICGATRPQTARACGRALALAAALDDRDRADLARAFAAPLAAVFDEAGASVRDASRAEVTMLIGLPGAGKTTVAIGLVREGWTRLSRDDRGGTLEDLARELDAALAAGVRRVVLDATYLTRALRSRALEVARGRGAAARCVWIDASIEQAQTNACARMIALLGGLPTPEAIAHASRAHPAVFGPSAQFRARRALEPPALDEGFASIDRASAVAWSRAGRQRAVVVEASAVVDAPADVAAWLRDRVEAGWVLLGTAWRLDGATLADLDRALGVAIAWAVCPHPPGPPVCWCRKPLPGLGVELVTRHDVDTARSIHVGRGPADRAFARRLGLAFVDVGDLPGWAPGA